MSSVFRNLVQYLAVAALVGLSIAVGRLTMENDGLARQVGVLTERLEVTERALSEWESRNTAIKAARDRLATVGDQAWDSAGIPECYLNVLGMPAGDVHGDKGAGAACGAAAGQTRPGAYGKDKP